MHSLEPSLHSQPSQNSQFFIVEEKNDLINETSPPINQLKAVDDVKIEEALQTGYAAYAEKAQTDIEQARDENSTGYVLTHEVAMLDDSTGYVGEDYLTEPEEDEVETNPKVREPSIQQINCYSNETSQKASLTFRSTSEEVLEVGDRIVEILSGIKGVVVGFLDGRVVFDCLELGRCSRRAILLKKI